MGSGTAARVAFRSVEELKHEDPHRPARQRAKEHFGAVALFSSSFERKQDKIGDFACDAPLQNDSRSRAGFRKSHARIAQRILA